jgi:hypothetical protein
MVLSISLPWSQKSNLYNFTNGLLVIGAML